MAIETTPYLGLPQWKFEDKPSYLVEMNGAYAKIDAGYRTIQIASEGAQTAAEGASAKAEQALTQSQANAGQIVTLGQEITQLEADYVNSHYSKQLNLATTPILTGVSVSKAQLTYNDYVGIFDFAIVLPAGTKAPTPSGRLELFQITTENLPTHRELRNVSNFAYTISTLPGYSISSIVTVDTNNKVIMSLSQDEIPTSVTITATITLPVFTISNAREGMFDNCLYVK